MTFEPTPVSRAREQVERQLREAILSGTFKSGDKLPSEGRACAEFLGKPHHRAGGLADARLVGPHKEDARGRRGELRAGGGPTRRSG